MRIKRTVFSLLAACFFWGAAAAQGGGDFLDLESFSSANGFRYRWDPLTQLASVSSDARSATFRVGSDYGLIEGRLVRLGEKTRVSRGLVQAPVSAREYLQRLKPTAFMQEVMSVPVPVSAPAVHRIRRVVIDAGHGGQDTGAVSPYGFKEKRVVLEVARKLKSLLEAGGLEVVMTRNSDVFIPLSERAEIANRRSADFFVSIHANASLARSLRGFEVYYLSEATDDAALALERSENSATRFEAASHGASRQLRTIVWDLHESENRRESLQIANEVIGAVAGSVPVAAQRVRSANFYVLKWTECPAVLIETGYLTNKEDERRLRDPVYKQDLAQAIAEGIWRYKRNYESTDGFTR